MSTTPNTEPTRVSTGQGPSPAEIAGAVAKALRGWSPGDTPVEPELWERFWHADSVESIEGDGSMWTGLAGLRAKNEWWESEHEIDNFTVDGPYVGATGFTLGFTMDVKNKKTGEVMPMREVGVYTVKDGKVVREEFMYAHE
jgi:hypothetical protein